MEIIEIEGAHFRLIEPDNWFLKATIVSKDRQRLGRVYEVGDSFRLLKFVRGSGAPQWVGDWWNGFDSPSIVSEISEGERLARDFIGIPK